MTGPSPHGPTATSRWLTSPTTLRLTEAGGGKLHLTTGRRLAGRAASSTVRSSWATPGTPPGSCSSRSRWAEGTTIEIDGDGTDAEISDRLYGIFYEDINYAADGGLYAELVRNRSFEFNTVRQRLASPA